MRISSNFPLMKLILPSKTIKHQIQDNTNIQWTVVTHSDKNISIPTTQKTLWVVWTSYSCAANPAGVCPHNLWNSNRIALKQISNFSYNFYSGMSFKCLLSMSLFWSSILNSFAQFYLRNGVLN